MDASSAGTPLTHRQSVLADGWSDHDLRRGERRGELSRIRRGSYADPEALASLDEAQRHRLVVQAATRTPTPCVVSHASAAAVWGLPLYRVDLSRVHFTRPRAAGGRRSAARIDHGGDLAAHDVTTADGIRVTSAARTIVDLARTESEAAAVVAADHALHHRLVTPDAIAEVLSRSARVPGVGAGRRALMRSDGRSESPGESLTRLALAGVAALDSQVTLCGSDGRFVARADFGVEDALLVIEFDGLQKYLGHRSPGQTIEDAVLSEKRREDAVRGLGYLVLRIVWRELDDRVALERRVSQALHRGRDLRTRGLTALGTYRPGRRIGLQ